jgi:N-glycosidase YbiA
VQQSTPARARRRALRPLDDTPAVEPVEEILRAKLAQHTEAQEALIKSGDEEIVEESPTDYFWGAGADGSGQNMLGKVWMKIRDQCSA